MGDFAKRLAADGFGVVVNYAGNGAAARYMICILQESVHATSVSTRETSSNRLEEKRTLFGGGNRNRRFRAPRNTEQIGTRACYSRS
jgi:hypothetical protein